MNTARQTQSAPAWPGLLAMLFATTSWGGLFHAGKQVLTRIDPFWFTGMRYSLAAVLLVAMLIATRQWSTEAIRRHGIRLAGYGLMGYGMFGILVFIGLSFSVPSHGAVVMATLPLSGLFVRWVLDGAQPAWWASCGALLALFGVTLVSGIWTAAAAGHSTLMGDAIAWVGTIGWILYTRGQTKVAGLSVMQYTGFTCVLAIPGLLLVAWLATLAGHAHVPTVAAAQDILPAFLYISVVATVLAALAYNFGVRRLGVSNAIVFINWVPVSAMLIGWARGQVPNQAELAGTLLVGVALVLMAVRGSTRTAPAEPARALAPQSGAKMARR